MNRLKQVAIRVLRSELPVPGVVRPLIRSVYRVGVVVSELSQLCFKWFVVAPVVRSIASVGKGLRIERIPYVRGKGQIVLGDDVYIAGKMDVGFGRTGGQSPETRQTAGQVVRGGPLQPRG